jgi:hypothetical protein
MALYDRIKTKLLGQNPVPLENLCDLPVSLGYDKVAGTIRALHGVADDLDQRVEVLEAAIREHWQESTHGQTADMRLADERLHRLIGLGRVEP